MFAKPNDSNLITNGGYYHQADNQYVHGYNHADYQYSGNERNHRVDDQYGGLGVIKQIIKDIGSV